MAFIAESERFLPRSIVSGDAPDYHNYALSERARNSAGSETVGGAWRIFTLLIGHWELSGLAPLALTLRGGSDRAIGAAGPFFPADWPEPELGWHQGRAK